MKFFADLFGAFAFQVVQIHLRARVQQFFDYAPAGAARAEHQNFFARRLDAVVFEHEGKAFPVRIVPYAVFDGIDRPERDRVALYPFQIRNDIQLIRYGDVERVIFGKQFFRVFVERFGSA